MEDPYAGDRIDDDAQNRSGVGLALPSQLGLASARVQLLNSVLFQVWWCSCEGGMNTLVTHSRTSIRTKMGSAAYVISVFLLFEPRSQSK
jgi:hypothetical protein